MYSCSITVVYGLRKFDHISRSFLSDHWSSTNIVCICYTAIFIMIWKILYCWVHQFSLANNHATIPELLLSQIDIDFTDLFSFKRWNNFPSFIFRVITASAGNDWLTEFCLYLFVVFIVFVVSLCRYVCVCPLAGKSNCLPNNRSITSN